MADNGLESFVYVFAFGVGLFFLAFLMLGDVPVEQMGHGSQAPGGGSYTPGTTTSQFNGLLWIPSFYLEAEKRQGVRTIDLGGFSVGYVKTMKTLDSEDRVIVDSGIFGAHSYSYTFSGDGEDALLSFDVNRTNKYGRLRVFLNNKKVYEGVPDGHLEIPLRELASTNTLVISAESSGPKIWAPTTYELTSLRLEMGVWEKKEKKFSFSLSPTEYEGFDRLEIHLETSKALREGDLYIELNGEELSRGRPLGGRLYSLQTEDKSVISSGTNYLEFSTGQNASYEFSSGEIRIFYTDVDKPATRQQEFYLSTSTYSSLGEKVPLYARISEIEGKTGIKVNGKEIEARLEQGDNLVAIPKQYLEPGERNKIEFYTLGSLRIDKAYIP